MTSLHVESHIRLIQPGPQVAVAHEVVCSDLPPIADSLVNSLNIVPAARMHVRAIYSRTRVSLIFITTLRRRTRRRS